MNESLFPALARDDVSYVKLAQLHDRLLAATKADTVKWEWDAGDGYSWTAPHGVVAVGPRGVRIWDDSGNVLRDFHPGNDGLYAAVKWQHEADSAAVMDRIIAELDAL